MISAVHSQRITATEQASPNQSTSIADQRRLIVLDLASPQLAVRKEAFSAAQQPGIRAPEFDALLLTALAACDAAGRNLLWCKLPRLVSEKPAFILTVVETPGTLPEVDSAALKVLGDMARECPGFVEKVRESLTDGNSLNEQHLLTLTHACPEQLAPLAPDFAALLINPKRTSWALQALKHLGEAARSERSKIAPFLDSSDTGLRERAALAIRAIGDCSTSELKSLLAGMAKEDEPHVFACVLASFLEKRPKILARLEANLSSSNARARVGACMALAESPKQQPFGDSVFDKLKELIAHDSSHTVQEEAIRAASRHERFGELLDLLLTRVPAQPNHQPNQALTELQRLAIEDQNSVLALAERAQQSSSSDELCRICRVFESDQQQRDPYSIIKFSSILPLLQHKNEQVFSSALRALAKLSQHPSQRHAVEYSGRALFTKLVTRLETPNDCKAYLEICANLAIGNPAVEQFCLRQIASSNSEIKIAACKVIASNSWPNPDFQPHLRGMLSHGDERAVEAAALALVRRGAGSLLDLQNAANRAAPGFSKSFLLGAAARLDPKRFSALILGRDMKTRRYLFERLLDGNPPSRGEVIAFLTAAYSPADASESQSLKEAIALFDQDLSKRQLGRHEYVQLAHLAGIIGPEAAPLAPLLVAQGLLAEAPDIRAPFVRALGNIGELAISYLSFVQRFVDDADPLLALTACEAYRRISGDYATLKPELLDKIQADLRSPNALFRQEAIDRARHLTSNQLEQLVEAVFPLLRDPSHPISLSAACLCGRLIETREDVRQALQTLFLDGAEEANGVNEVTESFVVDLAREHYNFIRPSHEAIRRGLASPSLRIRSAYCNLIAQHSPHPAWADLLTAAALQPGSEAVACRALTHYEELSDKCCEALKQLEGRQDEVIRFWAVHARTRAQSKQHSSEAASILLGYLNHPQRVYVASAAHALGRMEEPPQTALLPLLTALAHADRSIRYEAVLALTKYETQLVDYLRDLVRSAAKEQDASIRAELIMLVNAVTKYSHHIHSEQNSYRSDGKKLDTSPIAN